MGFFGRIVKLCGKGNDRIKKSATRAASHRDSYAPNWMLSRNTAQKSHGRRQPYRGFFVCLAEKPLTLECFAVLKRRFFLPGNPEDAGILCVLQGRWISLWEKRFLQNRVNPYMSPPKALHSFRFSRPNKAYPKDLAWHSNGGACANHPRWKRGFHKRGRRSWCWEALRAAHRYKESASIP